MKTVMKCWEEMPNEVLARAYSLHHQIVNAVIVNNEKNIFIRKGWVTLWMQEVIYS